MKNVKPMNFNLGNNAEIFLAQQQTGNKSVGEVANNISTLYAAQTKPALLRALLEKMFSSLTQHANMVDKYQPVLKADSRNGYIAVRVCLHDQYAVISNAKRLDYINAQLADLRLLATEISAVLDIALQDTIDGDKKGYLVPIRIFPMQHAIAKDLDKLVFKVNFKQKQLEAVRDEITKEGGVIDNKSNGTCGSKTLKGYVSHNYDASYNTPNKIVTENNKIQYAGTLYGIKGAGVERAVKWGNALGLSYEEAHFEDAEIAAMKIAARQFKDVTLAARDLKDANSVIYSSFRAQKEKTAENLEDLYEEDEINSLIANISNEEQQNSEIVTNLMRRFGEGLSSNDLMSVGRVAGASDIYGVVNDDFLGNAFASNAMPEEYVVQGIKMDVNSVDFSGRDLVPAKRKVETPVAEGQIVNVVNNRVGDYAVKGGLADGKYTVANINGRLMVGRSITEVMEERVVEARRAALEDNRIIFNISYKQLKGESTNEKVVDEDGNESFTGKPTAGLIKLQEDLKSAERLFVSANPVHGNSVQGKFGDQTRRIAEIQVTGKGKESKYAQYIDLTEIEYDRVILNCNEETGFIQGIIVGKIVGTAPSASLLKIDDEETEVVIIEEDEDDTDERMATLLALGLISEEEASEGSKVNNVEDVTIVEEAVAIEEEVVTETKVEDVVIEEEEEEFYFDEDDMYID